MDDALANAVCPACTTSSKHRIVEQRTRVPVLQNTVLKSPQSARNFPTGTVRFLQCGHCAFVWNDAFDEDLIIYDESYDNNVMASAAYRTHLRDRADSILAEAPIGEPISLVEIGCGEAEFMRILIERAKGRVVAAVGFDPSFSAKRDLPEIATVHRVFFGPDTAHLVPKSANIFVSRHTIEHVSDANKFAAALALGIQHADQVLYVETPTIDWIFDNLAFFDFFYEHCSLYNPTSIKRLFAAHRLFGETSTVYDGQYMWTKLRKNGEFDMKNAAAEVALSHNRAELYRRDAAILLASWMDRLAGRSKGERIGIWGAASKGVTFSLIADAAGNGVDFAIDLNPAKQGRYMPGSSVAITSPEDAQLNENDTVIVMNPNYIDEIRAKLVQIGVRPKVVSIS